MPKVQVRVTVTFIDVREPFDVEAALKDLLGGMCGVRYEVESAVQQETVCVLCGRDGAKGHTDEAGNFECRRCIERETRAAG